MAQAYLSINAQWQAMLAEVIERGVAAQVFRCDSSTRAARQIFALAMGYADDLMLNPSTESAESALGEVLEVAGGCWTYPGISSPRLLGGIATPPPSDAA